MKLKLRSLQKLSIAFVFIYFISSCNSRESRLKKQGNEIVKKIEYYKEKNNRLPNSLSEIGIQVIDESNPPLYYDKRDSINYTVSFGTSLGESMFYYSDSKKWEDRYRKMNKE